MCWSGRCGGHSVLVVRRSRSPLALIFGAAGAVALALFGVPATAMAQAPEAVVVLGDSAAAGDGADDYEPGTRGENDNWCHRSVHAYVHRTGLAPESVNLACSG